MILNHNWPYKWSSILKFSHNSIYCILKSFRFNTNSFCISGLNHVPICNSNFNLSIGKILLDLKQWIGRLASGIFLLIYSWFFNNFLQSTITWYAILQSWTSHPLACKIASTISISDKASPTVWLIKSMKSKSLLPFPFAKVDL